MQRIDQEYAVVAKRGGKSCHVVSVKKAKDSFYRHLHLDKESILALKLYREVKGY